MFSESVRATADPAEQALEVCTMADFSRRVPLHELRGRELMKELQLEILEQISKWPSAQAHVKPHNNLREAGWGAVIIAVDASGVWSLAGGAWEQWRRILLLSCSWARLARQARSPKLLPSRAMLGGSRVHHF